MAYRHQKHTGGTDRPGSAAISTRAARLLRRGVLGLLLAVVMGPATGCEVDSWIYDPSVVGRWERTALMLPILSELDVIDEPSSLVLGISQVQPEDLIPDIHEYVIGPGDMLTVGVFELIVPNAEAVNTRRVDELGIIRLPIIGTLEVAGQTPSGLERAIAEQLARDGILRDATVTVLVVDARQNIFSIIGEPSTGGTAFGRYPIPTSNFRLLDALAQARGAPGRTRRLFIFRQVPLSEQAAGQPKTAEQTQAQPLPGEEVTDPADLLRDIEDILDDNAPGLAPSPVVPPQPQAEPPPPALDSGLDNAPGVPRWVYVDGKWVQVEGDAAAVLDGEELIVTQRIIEIPFDRLLAGDMRYNVVIRPGDMIKVPARTAGFVYIGGAIGRPGAFTIPGEKELTITQLIISAGNLAPLAIPERVDLRRRIGEDQEAIVRLNVKRIFSGEQPNIFLKPNDEIIIGTNFFAAPLAVMRNGFRMSYGFGFVLDRNFEGQVYGPRFQR